MRHTAIKSTSIPKTLGSVDWWQTAAHPTQHHPNSTSCRAQMGKPRQTSMRHATVKTTNIPKTTQQAPQPCSNWQIQATKHDTRRSQKQQRTFQNTGVRWAGGSQPPSRHDGTRNFPALLQKGKRGATRHDVKHENKKHIRTAKHDKARENNRNTHE